MSAISNREQRDQAIATLLERDGPNCYYCGREFSGIGRHRTIDHAIPKSRGGTNQTFNLRLACFGCNHMKGDMTEEEFFESSGLQRSLAAIVNADRKRWSLLTDAVGLRGDGQGFWHASFTWMSGRPRCDLCGVEVERPGLLRWAPCSTAPITLY